MDKRLISVTFQQRVLSLIQASGKSRSAFAEGIGIDRSALSQLLTTDAVRLPRADTLARIALQYGVSVDWLLGIAETAAPSHSGRTEMAENSEYYNIPLLTQWHDEARELKIRYIPHHLPDILCLQDVVAWELGARHYDQTTIQSITSNLGYNRRTSSDMEICLPTQAILSLSEGTFPWNGLSLAMRRAQIEHMITRVAELYPSLRIFLFDERLYHSVPYTIFGSLRAAIYAGSQYIVFNDQNTVLQMQTHFDGLIRKASVQPHEISNWLQQVLSVMPSL